MSEPIFRPLVDLCDRAIMQVDPKKNPETDFWYVDISAVDNIQKRITAPQRIKGKNASVRAKQLIQKKDVLVATTRPNLNAVALVPEQYDGEICSTGFCVLRASAELDSEYLFQVVQSALFTIPLVELTKGALYPAVTNKQVFSQTIPWVPVPKQRQIAAHLKAQLAEVETTRQAAQVQLRDAALLRQRLLQAAFAQLTCAPTTLDSVLNDIQSGKSFQTAEVLARPDELGVLKVSAVSWSEFRADQAKSLKGEYQPADHHRVKTDDLLISRANTRELVGAVVLVDRDYPMRLLSDKTLRLIIDESRADKNYLLFALRTALAREHIELYATGTSDSMRNISQDVIASTPILLPPLEDQRLIVTTLKQQLAEADALRNGLEQQLHDLDALPQRILTQAFNRELPTP